jgi:ABC-2 type transport system permease protein
MTSADDTAVADAARAPARGEVARRFAALMRKETYQLLRDPSSVLIAFVLPVVLLLIFGFGVSLDANVTRIGLVIEHPAPATLDLAASFEASRYFEVQYGTDRQQFNEQLVTGEIAGIVVIPDALVGDFAAGRRPQVQVIVDGTEPNTARFVQNYAQGVVRTWIGIRTAETAPSAPAISLDDRYWFNPELTSRNFLVPGSIAIVMTLVGTLLTSLVVAREWERGTMEAIMATPISAVELLLGKVVPYFVLGLLSVTICLLMAIFLFGVPFRGSIFSFYLVAAVFLVPALGQGFLISAATKNQFLASQAALITGFLPAFLLSGFLFEISSMPQVIQWITYAVSARYLIPCLQTVFLAGDVWSLLLPNMAVMLLIGTVFFTLTIRNTRKRIA